MLAAAQLLVVIGTLIVVVPTRDGVVIVADSKATRRTASGVASVSTAEKVFDVPGVAGHAFFVTGASPVHVATEGQGMATIVDARGVVRARLWGRTQVGRADFDAVARECARLAARIHRMEGGAGPLVGRDLFTVGMVRAAQGRRPHEVASFVIRLTATSAEVSSREWVSFGPDARARVMMFGEGGFVGDGLPGWGGGAARCARQFLGSGRRTVRAMDAETASRGAYSIQEAASTAMGDAGTIGPPFRAYLLADVLRELPPVAPCRMAP